MHRRSRIFECLGAATLALTMAILPVQTRADESTADASNAGAPAPDKSDKKAEKPRQQVGIEEITVTARKREENLQSTPVAISAFSETDLKDQDIRRLNEITASVPTLQFDNAIGNSNASRIYLRGVGTGDPISTRDPGVGIYVDGVYFPRSQNGVLTVSDIERIEVLRGPQGTLFGKNTIGGAINILTQKPDPTDFSGVAEVRAGNFSRFDTRVGVNIPLVPEKAAMRLSFATATRDPVVRNKGTGPDLQDDKLLSGRAQFRVDPTDSLSLNFSADMSRENRVPFGGKCKVVNTNGVVPAARAFTLTVGQSLAQQGQNLALGPNAVNTFLNACSQDEVRSNRSVVSNLSFLKNNLETIGGHGTAEWQVNDNLTFKSISGIRHNDIRDRADLDYTELDLAQSPLDAGRTRQDSFSQEFQLVGSAMNDRFNYVLGVYGFFENINDTGFGGVATTTPLFFSGNGGAPTATNPRGGSGTQLRLDPANQKSATDQFRFQFLNNPAVQAQFLGLVQTIGADGQNRVVTQADIAETLAAAPGSAAANRVFAIPGAITNTVLKIRNQSYAGFTQGTYDVTDKLAVTLGLRLTAERKFVDYLINTERAGVIGGNARRSGETDFQFAKSARFSDLSPLANVSYQLTDDALLYSTFSRAFKSGGFNGRANADLLANKIDDENLTSYEVGFKSKWLDNRLIFNAAGFFSRYKDIQLTVPSGGNSQAQILILNVGQADIKGGELELVALPLPGLQLTSSIGILKSGYVKFDDPADPQARNRDLPASPNYTMNFSAAYQIPMGSMGDLRLRTEWAHRGASSTDVVNTRELRKGKNGELDATIGFAFADGVTEISLFGKNLLDREYFANGVSLGTSFGHAYRFFNDPRTYGIELRRQF
jgi:iron complex outermembrane receptor protein